MILALLLQYAKYTLQRFLIAKLKLLNFLKSLTLIRMQLQHETMKLQ